MVVLDLDMANRDHTPLTEVRSLLKGAKILGMTFGSEDHTTELAYRDWCGEGLGQDGYDG